MQYKRGQPTEMERQKDLEMNDQTSLSLDSENGQEIIEIGMKRNKNFNIWASIQTSGAKTRK